MARINDLSKYPKDIEVTSEDFLLGTNGDNNGKTQNYSVDAIAKYVSDFIDNGGSQIQSDWEQAISTEVDFIKNKPFIRPYFHQPSTSEVITADTADMINLRAVSRQTYDFDLKEGVDFKSFHIFIPNNASSTILNFKNMASGSFGYARVYFKDGSNITIGDGKDGSFTPPTNSLFILVLNDLSVNLIQLFGDVPSPK